MADAESTAAQPHPGEAHTGNGLAARLNWLRAGVLGANDGIVSTAGIVMGVAGATSDRTVILTAGIAGLMAGALSMAIGEYVSVSTQRDTEKALLAKEKWELENLPETELEELAEIYEKKGVEPDLARKVAEQLTAKDPLRAHAEAELGISPDGLTNPWNAAIASFVAFTVGALLPLLAISLPPQPARIAICVVAVALALLLTGAISARLGQADVRRAILRTVGGGLLAMAITYGVGTLIGIGI
jgi:VIT1/CCC1 family predicted Fe2+/Mn2+ transporter